MKTVGIRALQQNAARVLRIVAKGESVEVTERGRRVGWLVPATAAGSLEALEAAGRLVRAEGDLLDLGSPMTVKRGLEPPSKRLAAMRGRERS